MKLGKMRPFKADHKRGGKHKCSTLIGQGSKVRVMFDTEVPRSELIQARDNKR